jgi:hypothetical protein
MASYTIRLRDTEENDSVKVSFEAEELELVDEESKAFQLSAYVLDCIQSLEDSANHVTH